MQTKYILHGGSAQHVNEANDKFFAEILKGSGDRARVLLVEFAGGDENEDKNVGRDRSQFERVRGSREIIYEVADKDKFLEQVKEADVVYLGGGTTIRLMEELKNYSNLKDAFSGKVIAGESAGANIMSVYCFSKSGGGVMKGLGLVPVKMFPHYKDQNATELETVASELETYLLPNYHYRVVVAKD